VSRAQEQALQWVQAAHRDRPRYRAHSRVCGDASRSSEEQPTPQLTADLKALGTTVGQLYIDRGYINSTLVEEAQLAGAEIVCKPWFARGKPNLFKKTDFKFDMRKHTIMCPGGQTEQFEPGHVVEFEPEVCGACELRAQCTYSANGKGRTVTIAQDEPLQKKLRVLQSTPSGRSRLRERVGVEHGLAHVAARLGQTRSLLRPAQERIRHSANRGHTEPRDHPAQQGCGLTTVSKCSLL
jgi:hypothetical protein